jgi:hypothetical protein
MRPRLVCILLLVSMTASRGLGQITAHGYDVSGTIAPTLSETTGTQTQTIAGGSTLLSAVKSRSYCDPSMHQFGLAANASDTATTKVGASTINLGNNDVRFDFTSGIWGRVDDHGKPYTKNYLGVNADFFGNNSLGLGLQQTYTVEYQFYLSKCSETSKDDPKNDPRIFASVGVGAGFMSQRLYKTADSLNTAVLPLSAQFSYLSGVRPGIPPKAIWYALLGYMPTLNNTNAYQLSGVAGVQLPTKYRWLTVNISESELYMNNAPAGFRKNYQNGSVALIFTFPKNPEKVPSPATPKTKISRGACYGGDKLARLYCYDDVTKDACAPPNLFRAGGRCTSSGAIPAEELKDQ